MSAVTIRLIANAGVLIDYQGTQILIDALHEGHRLYPGTPPVAIQSLLDGHPPFEKLAALVFTHHHADHFSARLALNVLQRYPDLPFLSDEASASDLLTLTALESEWFDKSRIRTFSWKINTFELETAQQKIHSADQPVSVGPFTLEPISFLHEGKRFEEVANIGYIISVGGRRILYPGDARISPDNFQAVTQTNQPIDAAILMFPYISTGRGQNLIRDILHPRQIVAVHLPDPERDTHDFLKNAYRAYERSKDKLPETVFLHRYLDFTEL